MAPQGCGQHPRKEPLQSAGVFAKAPKQGVKFSLTLASESHSLPIFFQTRRVLGVLGPLVPVGFILSKGPLDGAPF